MKIILFISTLFITLSAQSLNIDTYLELIRKNNKDILLAAKDVEYSQAQKDEAQGNAYPSLSAEGNYKRYLKDSYMFVDMPGIGKQEFKVTKKNDFSFQTVLVQPIFNYTVFNAIKAAREYEELTNYTYQATVDAVLNGAKKAFYQTLLLHKIIEVKKISEENARLNYEQVKSKFETGIASKFELLQAEVRWKNSIPETQQAERNYKLALNSLKILGGIPVENNLVLIGNLESFPLKPDDFSINESLKRRSDYNAMIWENNLRTTNISVEESGHYPTLYANMAYSYSSQSDKFDFSNQNNVVVAGLNLRIPIFNGWQTTSKVQKAKIEVEKSQIRINKFKEKVATDLTNINLRLEEALKRIQSANVTMETAKQAVLIAETSAKNGLATQLELKDANGLNEQSQLAYYAAVYEYLESYFDWEFTSGMIK